MHEHLCAEMLTTTLLVIKLGKIFDMGSIYMFIIYTMRHSYNEITGNDLKEGSVLIHAIIWMNH